MSRSVFLLSNFCLILVFSGCSLNKPHPAGKQLNKPSLTEMEGILFPEVSEFADAGIEFMSDSLWFEAQASFDSALVRLTSVLAGDSTDSIAQRVVLHFQDSLYSLLIQAVTRSTGMILPFSWTDYWDTEMESISDSQLDSIKGLTEGVLSGKFKVPIRFPLHPRIIKAMAVLTGPGRRYFGEWLNRKSLYGNMIEKKLVQNNMPPELIYLAMVESGFSPRAFSRAKASGIWQFIKSTGGRYGLKYDWWKDERRDPEKSTDAAIVYLSELYEEFGNWEMAMAGYNCGENRIRKQLKNNSVKTYWDMVLPRETMKYVPKILAAMIIGENPHRYGFYIEPKPSVTYDTVTVRHCLSLTLIAEITGVQERDIKRLNPELRRWCTPPGVKQYLLKIPSGSRNIFLAKYNKLNKKNLVTWQRHTVRRGETLGLLARKYGVSVNAIRSTNNIRRNLIRVGQTLVIPLRTASLGSTRARPSKSQKAVVKGTSNGRIVKYRVKKGDNLYKIAGKFGTSVSALRQLNGLHNHSIIKAGELIKVPQTSVSGSSKWDAKGASSSNSFKIYNVRAGDNLIAISRKLGVSVQNLKAWNSLHNSKIKVGQKLKYQSMREGHAVYYIVKPKDNLWDIARKFKTSIKQIKEKNPDMPKILKPGMKIRVK